MKFSVVLGVSLALALVVVVPAGAVDEGVPDRDAHPNVGLLGVDFDGGGAQPPSLWCTGSVVSDRAFLTAAHCIASELPVGVEWVVTLRGGGPASPVATPGLLPDDFPFAFTVPAERAIGAVVHPNFGGIERPTHDVAVVVFAAGTFAGVTPIELPRARLLNRLRREGGLRRQQFRLVGYGTDPEWGNGAPQFVSEGYRQTATAPFERLTPMQLHLKGDARMTGQGGLCHGDSGSPQFLGDSNLAVSVFSDSGETCRGPIQSQRLDTPSERRFLSRYVDLP